jgi:hypothetical protein
LATSPGAEIAPPRVADRPRWALRALAAYAGVVLAGWLYVATAQLAFPGDLSGWEGAIVDHVRRVIQGQPLYARPDLLFTPLLYGPFYYWICAALSWAGDLAFAVPRAVSALATLLSALCLAGLVRLFTGQILAGIVGAGLFLAAAPWSDNWYALAHVDALFLALMLLALLLWFGKPTPVRLLVCGVVLAAAVLTKQSAALLVLVVALDGVLRRRREIALAMLGATAIMLPAGFWLAADSGNWAWYFLIVMPQKFGINLELMLVPAWDLKRMAPALLLGIAALVMVRRDNGMQQLRGPVLCVGVLIAIGWLGRLHPGSGHNALMPMIAGLALLAGCALGWPMRRPTPPLYWAAVGLVALQFAVLAYDPRRVVPSPGLTRNVLQARSAATALPPSSLIFGNGFLVGRIAGSEPIALRDYLGTLGVEDRKDEIARLRDEIADRGVPPVVATRLGAGLLAWLLAGRYGQPAQLVAPSAGDASWPDKAADLVLLSPR